MRTYPTPPPGEGMLMHGKYQTHGGTHKEAGWGPSRLT